MISYAQLTCFLKDRASSWSDPEASRYPPEFSSLSPRRWAWEFLRRNDRYCRDFCEVQEALSRVPEDFPRGLHPGKPGPTQPGDEYVTYRVHRKSGATSNAYMSLGEHLSMVAEMKAGPVRDAWGVLELVDPRRDQPPLFRIVGADEETDSPEQCDRKFEADPMLELGTDLDASDGIGSLREVSHRVLNPGEVFARFNLNRDLGPQLKRAKFLITELQQDFRERGSLEPTPRVKDKYLPFYLRLLDASLLEVSAPKIADAFPKDPLHPSVPLDEKTVYDRLDSAKRYTEPEGYLKLLLRSPS